MSRDLFLYLFIFLVDLLLAETMRRVQSIKTTPLQKKSAGHFHEQSAPASSVVRPELAIEEINGSVVCTNPRIPTQEVVNFVWKNQLLEGDAVLTQ